MTPINPTHIRYIKLGAGGRWAEPSLQEGELHFGYRSVPHELCLADDWDAVARFLVEQEGKSNGKARDGAREIRDFYTLGSDCLWVTFANGHLWWAFADPDVEWLGTDPTRGARMRKTLDGWHNTDAAGEPLFIDNLSTLLTQVAAYRQTICRVKAEDYLLRRINALEEPLVARAREARHAMSAVARDMIARLHWADFETLVDLIFTRSGWQRLSRVGGSQKDVDLVLEQPATGEKAFVQVKSTAAQPVLNDYTERFRMSGAYERMFFVCHTPKGALTPEENSSIHIWAGDRLADAAVGAGLFDWLVERSG